MLAFYAPWCKPCHLNMSILQSLEKRNEDLQIIYISSSDWLERENDLEYLRHYKVKNKNSLIIDIYKYGDKYMPWERLDKVITELENRSTQDIGLPYYILFDNQGKLLISAGGYPFPTENFQKILDEK